jgi:hypothetical protein
VLCSWRRPRATLLWLAVENGAATFRLPVEGHFRRACRAFILMRGRLPTPLPPGNNTDLGKPATLAATAWVE